MVDKATNTEAVVPLYKPIMWGSAPASNIDNSCMPQIANLQPAGVVPSTPKEHTSTCDADADTWGTFVHSPGSGLPVDKDVLDTLRNLSPQGVV